MNIIYEDEYGEAVYLGESSFPAQVGDTVVIDDEDYRLKSRIFYPQYDKVVITVTQNMVKSGVTESVDNSRQNEMQHAILALSKKQEAADKKHRALNEQLVSIRKHINQQIRKESKDGNT